MSIQFEISYRMKMTKAIGGYDDVEQRYNSFDEAYACFTFLATHPERYAGITMVVLQDDWEHKEFRRSSW